MKTNRTAGAIAAAVSAIALLVGPNASATSTDPPPDDSVVVSQTRKTERLWIDVIGEYRDLPGTLTITKSPGKATSSLERMLSSDSALESTASSCTQAQYVSDPYRVRSSSSPYYVYAVAGGYKSLSSGCTKEYIYLTLKKMYGPGDIYKKTVDSDDGYAYPGGPRQNLSVSDLCGKTTYTYFGLSNLYQRSISPEVRLCP